MVGVYYRPLDQGKPVDEAFLLHLQEALTGSHPAGNHLDSPLDVCWKSSMASRRQSRGLLQSVEENFLSQVINSPTRGDALLDLIVTNTITDITIGDSLGCSDHALVEFTVLRDMGQAKRRADASF